MKQFFSLKQSKIKGPVCLALGNFDGLHIGHQELINACKKYAREERIYSGVFTFSNNPADFIASDKNIQNIYPFKVKQEKFQKSGLDFAVYETFDAAFMTMKKEEFVLRLTEAFDIRMVFVGFNYRFGDHAEGDVDDLSALGKKYHFDVAVIPAKYDEGQLVSSSLIREQIANGEVSMAAKLLGERYAIHGIVTKGRQLGKKLFYPTANILLEEGIVKPKFGVYKTYTEIRGRTYLGISNIGTNPTIGQSVVKLENYIFGFDEEIYGEEMIVYLDEFVREERKFDSFSDLKSQMNADIQQIGLEKNPKV